MITLEKEHTPKNPWWKDRVFDRAFLRKMKAVAPVSKEEALQIDRDRRTSESVLAIRAAVEHG